MLRDLSYGTVNDFLRTKEVLDYWLYTEGTVGGEEVGLFTTRYPMADDKASTLYESVTKISFFFFKK